jgi:roadblock/LC7 domain-containing protein
VTNSTSSVELPWMLDELVEMPHVISVVVLSTDGLIVQKSTSMVQELAEILAAGASSMYSVAAGTGRRFASGQSFCDRSWISCGPSGWKVGRRSAWTGSTKATPP